MGVAIALVLAGILSGTGGPARVVLPEGWYQIEEGYGETEDAEILVIVTADEQQAVQPGPDQVIDVPEVPPEQDLRTPPPPEQQAQPPRELRPPAPKVPEEVCPPEGCGADDEIARFRKVDCELVRGRYLKRLLELHGVNAFGLDARALAAWTYVRPPPQVAAFGFNGTLGDPAMAPLYGEPPIPPGSLSFDLELQALARDLLTCQNAAR